MPKFLSDVEFILADLDVHIQTIILKTSLCRANPCLDRGRHLAIYIDLRSIKECLKKNIFFFSLNTLNCYLKKNIFFFLQKAFKGEVCQRPSMAGFVLGFVTRVIPEKIYVDQVDK